MSATGTAEPAIGSRAWWARECAETKRRRAATLMHSRQGNCSTCITTEYPGQPCTCQCPVCVAAQASTAPRFAIAESTHGWRWTYTNITAAEAQWIADTLEAGSGETWTVAEIPAT